MQMTDADLRAIATYLEDGTEPVPPAGGSKTRPATPLPTTNPVMVAGGAIYRDVCSACHALNGRGVPKLFPSLANSSLVRSKDPTTLIRLMLEGSRSGATTKEPTAPGMPSFAWQLKDNEIAAVLTYVRNSWGSAAPAVSSDDVHRDRGTLARRSD